MSKSIFVSQSMSTPRQIIAKHAEDLPSVDTSLVEKDIVAANDFFSKNENALEAVLDQLALVCNDKTLIDPQWALLAGRLQMENIHRLVPRTFSEATKTMRPILNESYYNFVMDHAKELDELARADNDFKFDIFSTSTLRKSYLAHVKRDDQSFLMETPQYMYLRVATFLRKPNMVDIKNVYSSLSNGDYSHATPTLFNAGMIKPQCSSCFLGTVSDDMSGISKSWHDHAIISMNSGGIGCDFSQIRHSEIGQHGFSRGIVPWLKITNEILKTVDQAGKRKGSGTMYLKDWHVDVFEFIELKDEGPEDMRAKDLFLALMISDLFMKRVEADEVWSLFCPNKAKGLVDVYGQAFEELYLYYERAGIFSHQVRARELWQHILNMQIKKSAPFLLYADACNLKSNQKNSGIVRCSNLCCEITLNTSPDEIASCILSSTALNRCVEYNPATGRYFFNFDKLERLVAEQVYNLNKVIDYNYYPDNIPEIKTSNMRHRPLGIGVQGLADTFALLDISWVIPNPCKPVNEDDLWVANPKAQKLNDQIFETMYFAAVKASVDLAKTQGPYPSFSGSPASQGQFQFDMWGVKVGDRRSRYTRDQWETLRSEMMKFGLRNSTLTAVMPTASSAHILGNNEACEPFTELIFARSVLAGQFMLVNKHLIRDLKAVNMWNDSTIKSIISNRGSMKEISVPESDPRFERIRNLKMKYLTVFEIPQKATLQLTADRGRFICQTQSSNCFMAKPTRTKLNAYHFHAWKLGLKTGMYYLRQKALTDPINFASDTKIIPVGPEAPEPPTKRRKWDPKTVSCNPDGVCMACNV